MRGGDDNIELARTNAGPPPPHAVDRVTLAIDSKSTAKLYY